MSAGRSRRANWLLATVLIWGALLAIAPVLAQGHLDGPSPNAPWTSKIPELLRLDEEQKAAFSLYVSTLADRQARAPSLTADQFRAMTMPERFDYLADHIETDLTSARATARSLHQFYDLLSPEQRKLFDDKTRPPAGRAGVAADAVSEPPPAMPNYRLPSHTEPAWMVKPRGEDVARVYPAAALKEMVTGSALMTCAVDEDGYLADCVIDDETPAGAGFGNAALEVSAYMRMFPATNYGVPVRSSITIPVRFVPPK